MFLFATTMVDLVTRVAFNFWPRQRLPCSIPPQSPDSASQARWVSGRRLLVRPTALTDNDVRLIGAAAFIFKTSDSQVHLSISIICRGRLFSAARKKYRPRSPWTCSIRIISISEPPDERSIIPDRWNTATECGSTEGGWGEKIRERRPMCACVRCVSEELVRVGNLGCQLL